MNLLTEYIIVTNEQLAKISLPAGVLIRRQGRVRCVLEGKESVLSFLVGELRCQGVAVLRIMDRVYFTQDVSGILAGSDEFFDSIAPEYIDLVDTSRNSGCAERLLSLGLADTRHSGSVLDFGCGPGAVSERIQHLCESLVLYDSSPAMRELARAKGLRVLDSLTDAGADSFDCIIAVYVLHFGLTMSNCSELFRLVRSNGHFAGNCHKGLGLALIVQRLTSAGFGVRVVDEQSSEYGPIVLAEKP